MFRVKHQLLLILEELLQCDFLKVNGIGKQKVIQVGMEELLESLVTPKILLTMIERVVIILMTGLIEVMVKKRVIILPKIVEWELMLMEMLLEPI